MALNGRLRNALGAAILLAWQLPQVLLGLTVVVALRARRRKPYLGVAVFEAARLPGGVSFGPIILLNRNMTGTRLLKHEYGHSRQSRLLGPLYLPVVGLPSVTFAMLTHVGVLRRKSYFSRYPENWADRLGGVEHSTDGSQDRMSST